MIAARAPTVCRALVLAILLAGCDRSQPAAAPDTPGARLEHAARSAGLVPDPDHATLIGSWAKDTDRVCVVAGPASTYRIGALVDYGEGQGCAASGTATRSGDRVDIRFGACVVRARFDGERLVFPPEIPRACEAVCVGRASLAALAVAHISESSAEAATLRTPGGRLLCGD